MLVKDLMTTEVITVGPEATVEQVADVLHHYHFTGVPVVKDGKLLGVIMERDFITASSALYLPTYIKMLRDFDFVQNDKKRLPKEAAQVMTATAKDIMNSNIVTVSPEATIQELAESFATKRVNPIPVVDGDFMLVGVISRSDLIKLFSGKSIEANREKKPRLVDVTAEKGLAQLGHSFALVTKTRAALWLLLSLSFFVIGFILGGAWLIDY